MIKRRESMTTELKPNLKGGKGTVSCLNIFTQEELSKTRLFAVTTVQPGDSIGEHSHTGEGEVYVVLDGSATIKDDGVEYIMHVGDAQYCTDGHSHAVYNHTDKPVSLLSIVIL